MEKAGTDLQADGKDKEDQAEFLDEMEYAGIGDKAEMADQDSDEKDPGRAEGHPFEFEFPQIESCSDDKGQEQDRLCGYRFE